MSLMEVAAVGAVLGVFSAINATIVRIGTDIWEPVEWEGFMMGITSSGFSVGGYLVSLTSELVNGERGRCLYLLAVAGIDFGLKGIPVSVTGAPIKMETPGVFGPRPWVFSGLFGMVGVGNTYGVSIGASAFSMGFGVGHFSPGLLVGLDLGILGVGGVSIPLYLDPPCLGLFCD
jgi:hypothetical protein